MKPRLAVLLPMVWSVRNVVHSGVLKRLQESGIDVHLIWRNLDRDEAIENALPDEALTACKHPLVSPKTRSVRGRALVESLLRSAFNQRHNNASYSIYSRWFGRHDTMPQAIRRRALDHAAKALKSTRALQMLSSLRNRLAKQSRSIASIREQLEEIAPDALWSTVCVSPYEEPYYAAARELGIPVMTSVLSFDNLTSRGMLPEYDRYLLWNEGMQQQLCRLYPEVASSSTAVTGTPQFDFHRRKDLVWTRQQTLERLNLRAEERYFLYAGSSETLTPDEPELVQRIAVRMREHRELSPFRLLVRLHPLDDWARWSGTAAVCPNVCISKAWDHAPDASGWSTVTLGDQARWVNTLRYAEACINVASTAALDAAILDKPVIGIRFDRTSDVPAGILYEEYNADHYRPLVESGGLGIAANWDELLSLSLAAISEPSKGSAQRARMVRKECGIVDEFAADRVAAAVADFVRECCPSSVERDTEKVC